MLCAVETWAMTEDIKERLIQQIQRSKRRKSAEESRSNNCNVTSLSSSTDPCCRNRRFTDAEVEKFLRKDESDLAEALKLKERLVQTKRSRKSEIDEESRKVLGGKCRGSKCYLELRIPKKKKKKKKEEKKNRENKIIKVGSIKQNSKSNSINNFSDLKNYSKITEHSTKQKTKTLSDDVTSSDNKTSQSSDIPLKDRFTSFLYKKNTKSKKSGPIFSNKKKSSSYEISDSEKREEHKKYREKIKSYLKRKQLSRSKSSNKDVLLSEKKIESLVVKISKSSSEKSKNSIKSEEKKNERVILDVPSNLVTIPRSSHSRAGKQEEKNSKEKEEVHKSASSRESKWSSNESSISKLKVSSKKSSSGRRKTDELNSLPIHITKEGIKDTEKEKLVQNIEKKITKYGFSDKEKSGEVEKSREDSDDEEDNNKEKEKKKNGGDEEKRNDENEDGVKKKKESEDQDDDDDDDIEINKKKKKKNEEDYEKRDDENDDDYVKKRKKGEDKDDDGETNEKKRNNKGEKKRSNEDYEKKKKKSKKEREKSDEDDDMKINEKDKAKEKKSKEKTDDSETNDEGSVKEQRKDEKKGRSKGSSWVADLVGASLRKARTSPSFKKKRIRSAAKGARHKMHKVHVEKAHKKTSSTEVAWKTWKQSNSSKNSAIDERSDDKLDESKKGMMEGTSDEVHKGMQLVRLSGYDDGGRKALLSLSSEMRSLQLETKPLKLRITKPSKADYAAKLRVVPVVSDQEKVMKRGKMENGKWNVNSAKELELPYITLKLTAAKRFPRSRKVSKTRSD